MNEEKKIEILLEQYKLYVQMADNVSARRTQANAFYITVLSGLLAVLSLAIQSVPTQAQNTVFLAVALLGIVLCYIWYVNIRSYQQLNTGKFAVIHEIEQSLPYAGYEREWKFLGEGKEGKRYLQLTRVEQNVPLLLTIPYILLLIYATYHILKGL